MDIKCDSKFKLAYVTNAMNRTGISAVIMNYCRFLDLNKFCVHLIVCGNIEADYESELSSAGVVIHRVTDKKESTLKYVKDLKRLFKKEKFDVVHVHGNSSTMVLELSAAKKCGVPIRIAHSHNSVCGNALRHKLLFPFFKRSYTHAFACSNLAGEWIFGKGNFTVINNGIDTDKFKFDVQKRKEYRTSLNLNEDSFVIGHVGRFNKQKNHGFLLNLFEKIAEKNDKARLLLIGGGPDFDKVNELISRHTFKERIIVYGETNDIANLYNAMDAFVLPSLYEGLPVTLVEAQVNGLNCFVSDVITNESAVGGKVFFIPLSADLKIWADSILDKQNSDRADCVEEFNKIALRYDIRNCVKELQKIYLSLAECES